MARVGVRRDTGKLFFDFKWAGRRCRELTSLSDSPQNRKRAEQVLRGIQVDIQRGEFDYARYFPNSAHANLRPLKPDPSSEDDSGGALFRDFAEIWVEENQIRWRRTTRGLMRMILGNHLLPVFADRPVGEITRAEVLAFRSEFGKRRGKRLGETISPKTVNDTIGVLKGVLDEAAARYGFTSPCQRIKRLKVPRSDVQPFTLEEVMRLIETVRPDYKDYLIVRFFTGMRTGEANGLRWEHVDFARRQILVRETFTHGERDSCKTDSSWREIDMSQPVRDALVQRFGAGKPLAENVFSNAVGGPLDNHNFTNRVWYPLLRYVGLAKRRPYQMRHTAATLWLASGENPTWIARQLGHASLEMLFRVYARWSRDMTRRDGSAFDALLKAHRDEPKDQEAEA